MEREESIFGEKRGAFSPRIFAYCDHCGFAIYSEEDALILNDSEDIVHIDCWEEYAMEHMFDFATRASDIEC